VFDNFDALQGKILYTSHKAYVRALLKISHILDVQDKSWTPTSLGVQDLSWAK